MIKGAPTQKAIKTSFHYKFFFLDFKYKKHEYLHKLNPVIQFRLKCKDGYNTTPKLWTLSPLSLPLPGQYTFSISELEKAYRSSVDRHNV